ncbi:MAG TPA: hypothetical protein VL401_04255 [Alphaproteobacteria bacterium]|nr:hypothetical protein [Alphaproteobacteria bacterium]
MKNLIFKNYYYASFILNLLLIIGIFLCKSFLPPVVPLFYGAAEGAGQLVPTFGLLLAPGISLVITGINIWLSLIIKDEFSKKVLGVTSFSLTIITTITVAKIIFLVGFF